MASGSPGSNSGEPLLSRDGASTPQSRDVSLASGGPLEDSEAASSTAGARTISADSSALHEAPVAKKSLAQQDSKVGQPSIENHRYDSISGSQEDIEQQGEHFLEEPLSSDQGTSGVMKHPSRPANLNVIRGCFVASGCCILVGAVCFLFAVKALIFNRRHDHQVSTFSGFCCWRQHPLPYYQGDACNCPIEHRGYFECPPNGCSDSSGERWQRGHGLPEANDEAHCKSSGDAAWCHTDLNQQGVPVPIPLPSQKLDRGVKRQDRNGTDSFCCWRDHPVPFYYGDPCECPLEHRGYFNCPPGGCTDKSLIFWTRGRNDPYSNDYHACKSSEGTADWCGKKPKPTTSTTHSETHHHSETHKPKPTMSKPKHRAQPVAVTIAPAEHEREKRLKTTTESPSPHLQKDGFCCWRDHPLPFYSGDPCSCPQQHRGNYECPPSGCNDPSGTTWHRGSTFPIANTQTFCQHPKHKRIANWCAPPAAPAHLPGPSLFCWTVIKASSPELVLLKHHFSQGENIFACDDQLIISDENVTIGDAFVWTLGAFNSKRAPWHAWYNVPLFARAWKAVLKYSLYKKYDWTVKMDADAVVNVRALRAKLSFHAAGPDQAVYWENYNGSEINVSFNFLGPLEVFSRHAMDIFAKRGEYVCPVPKVQVQGEDAWMDACMKKLHVQPRRDFSFLKNACTKCPVLAPLACASCKYAAFHPFKDIRSYRECSRLVHSSCRG